MNAMEPVHNVKSKQELERLRAAQALTDAAYHHIVDFVTPGVTELQIQQELDSFMFAHGAQDLAFPSIIATGPNAFDPHAQPGNNVLEPGQCVVMDFGAVVEGYCADMTRMLFVGQPSQRLAYAYAVLREANETVEALLRPGMSGAAAHNLALAVLEAGGFKDCMPHGLGHSVGTQVHEDPPLAPRYPHALEAGNVLTVEPGIYIEGEFGMRLEDCGVLTENGFQPFTSVTHDMVIV